MVLRARCPKCGLDYTLADTLRGKRLRCKECQEVFTADEVTEKARPQEKTEPEARMAREEMKLPAVMPLDEEDRPRRRSKPDEDEARPGARKAARPAPRRPSGGSALLVFVCVIGGALLLAGLAGGGVWLVLAGRPQFDPPDGPPQVWNPPPGWPQNPPANPGGNPPPNPGFVPNPPQPPPPAVPVWSVKADPVPRPPVKVANAGKPIALGGDFPQVLIAPSRPSPFLSSGLNDFPQHKREVWNLETMERTASFSGFQMTDHGVLSPDGAYVAGKFNQPNLPFVVISCKDGKKVFELDDINLTLFDFLDFAGPRLVIGLKEFEHRAYHLFDITTGRKLRQFTTPPVQHEAKADALSGGGKYLALKSGNDVLIFDLDSGKQAGQFAISGSGRGNQTFRELAFSPDGKELALLFDSPTSMRLVTWDLVGNRPGVDHRMPASVVRGLKTPGTIDGPNIYFGRHLEWLGDGSGWLVRGEVVIDKVNGAAVWKVPITGDDWRWTRHVVGTSHVARLGGTFEARTLELLEIRRGEFVAGGPNPDPVKPPNPPVPPPPADLAGDGTPQPADVDPAPAPKGGLLDALELAGKPEEIKRVLFSRPDVAQAAVVTIAANADRTAPRPASLERYDLTTGKSLGKLELYDTRSLFPHDPMADLSGDGTLFALTHLQDQKRLEVWDLAQGKRVASWMPYEKSPGLFAEVSAVAVVDAKHVLTVNLPGDVILWSVPECKQVRTWNNFANHRQVLLTPGRKYVVLRGQKGLALCNPLTGEVRGRFPFPAELRVLEILAGTFRPDGKEFAAVVTNGDGRGPAPRHLVRWDAPTGKVIDSHPVAVTPWTMNWCGDSGLLLDWTLLDWKSGVQVCTYSAPFGRAAHGSPDGRFWFTQAAKPAEPVRLRARALPEETAKQAAAQLAAGQVQLVLKPGTKISLQLDATGPAGEPMWRQQYEQRLANDLNNTAGLLVAEGQPVTLKLSAKESDTGEKLRATLLVRQGKRNNTRTEVPDVPRKRLTCQATLTDAQGKALMEPKDQVFEFPDLIVAAENRDDPVGTVSREQSKRLWNTFSSWVYSAGVPAFVAREGDKIVPWPRTVELGQARE
jgi:WD40 repeat protein